MWKIGLVYLLLRVGGGVGWVYNVVKLCKADFEAPYKAEVIRSIGIPIFPVGAVIGYIHFDEERKRK
jgi:hypothetical protein